MVRINTRIIFLFLLLCISAVTKGQNIRGFYLQNIGTWLGNATKENAILNYAQGNGFNYINFYDLNDLDWSSASDKNKLASFISRGRSQFGITEWGAVIETYDFAISNIIPYNNSRIVAGEKFDLINFEFEYWVSSSIHNLYCAKYLTPNGLTCDSAGAYKFAWKQFKKIDSLCTAHNLLSEFYLGWPNKGQMQQIVNTADRIFLHAYRPTDSDVYSYSKNRLSWIGQTSSPKKVIVLFSSETAFMGSWLNSHPITRPYQTYSSDLSAETASWKQNINLQGYHWFTYAHMPQTVVATATITASGPLTFCSGGSVTLTANSGTAYLWSPGGATTRSITVSAAGSYTVKVTNSSGTKVTSIPTVVTISTTGITPTVTVSGQSNCGSATLTSSQASSYLWSNGATTQAITVSTSGSYTVTTGSGTCAATSTPSTITVGSAPATPVVSANGPLDICQGSQLTLTSTTANSYSWSNGATTRSIVVSAAGNYSVSVYSGPNCSASSSVQAVTVLTRPTTPVITPTGSTTLSATNTNVPLTSSATTGNHWSNGATSRSITVYSTGTYSVYVTGTNGCSATSTPVIVDGVGCVAPAVPTITANGPTTITSGQTVTLTSSLANGYLWSTGDTTQSITVSLGGDYTVTVFGTSIGCFAESLPVTVIVNLNTGISTLPASGDKINFSLYPNPATDKFNVIFTLDKHRKIKLNMTDVTGREIYFSDIRGIPGENQIEINTAEYSRGIYFVNLLSDDYRQMIKVVIE